jgi:hypothetical protein
LAKVSYDQAAIEDITRDVLLDFALYAREHNKDAHNSVTKVEELAGFPPPFFRWFLPDQEKKRLAQVHPEEGQKVQQDSAVENVRCFDSR